MIKIGLLHETKNPVDNRVALTPQQAQWLQEKYHVQVFAQTSDTRVFKDSEYIEHGINICDSLNDCDLLLGIKEADPNSLIKGKN